MEKLNRAAKCSILGPQNLGSGEPGPPGPPPGSAAGHCTKSSWLHSTTLHARGTVAPRPTEWSCIIARQLWTEDIFVTVRDNDVRRLHPTTPPRSYNPPFIKRFQNSLLAHHSYAHLFTLHFSRVTNTWLTISLFFGGHRVQHHISQHDEHNPSS